MTAGPFPVRETAPELASEPGFSHGQWIYWTIRPCPPAAGGGRLSGKSSLPKPLRDVVANRLPPSKDSPSPAWLSRDLYEAYLRGEARSIDSKDPGAVNDHDFCDAEPTIGIGVSRETGTSAR